MPKQPNRSPASEEAPNVGQSIGNFVSGLFNKDSHPEDAAPEGACPHCGAHNLLKNADTSAGSPADVIAKRFRK